MPLPQKQGSDVERQFNVGNSHSDGNQINDEFSAEPNISGNISANKVDDKPELTCISEEGIADMDLPDNVFDELDFIGDCITSCNRVKDNNLKFFRGWISLYLNSFLNSNSNQY